MKGWNLDYQALEADYRAKHPNYNRNRVCTVCGGHFASGKPRSMCLGCMRNAGLIMEATPVKAKPKMTWLSPNVLSIIGIAMVMFVCILTDEPSCALFTAFIAAIIMLRMAITPKE